jgi:hypothetical protein
MTLRRWRRRPCLPVRSLTASSSGRTWARSSPWAGVERLANGIPVPSVRLWMSMPWPCPPRAPPAPPPLPGGKSAIDGAIRPVNHALFLGNPENPRLHHGERAIGLLALQPAMGDALRRPLRPLGHVTPAAAGDQDIEQCIQYIPQRCTGHATPALRRCWRKNILEQALLQGTHTFKLSCHSYPSTSIEDVQQKTILVGYTPVILRIYD